MALEREAIEAHIVATLRAGNAKEAAAALVRLYGAEVFGYLLRFARTAVIAEDAFSRTCEGIVRDLVGFRGSSSLRTWSYAIARRSLAIEHRSAGRRSARTNALDFEAMVDAVAEVRERTATFLRTAAKDRFTKLRKDLSEGDEELLVLRLQNSMSWIDIARVQGATEGSEKKAAAALRKRYERLRAALRSQLLSEDDAHSQPAPLANPDADE